MIYTVFCTASGAAMDWQSELLEYSWGRVGQAGELLRLVAAMPGQAAPTRRLARVFETHGWSPHPYTGDTYFAYNKAAAVLEWLFEERIEGTVLLLDAKQIFRSAVSIEVERGQARAHPWPGRPRGDGPFGLGPAFEFLVPFCVDRTLELGAVTLPALIHSTDLRRIAARWLELMSIIRAETAGQVRLELTHADTIAYLIAAAEAGIRHEPLELSVGTDAEHSAAPLLSYQGPVLSTDGGIVWDPEVYRCWDPVQPESALVGTGRELLIRLSEVIAHREQGLEFAFVIPTRCQGVREGKILGSLFLEIPGRAETVSLNASGAAIWEACDGVRGFAEINRELETRFQMPAGSLRADVEVVIKRLERIRALSLDPARVSL